MKPSKEQVEAYKSMAKQSPQTMEGLIKTHLEQNCQKYAGNEDKIDRCIKYLTDCAREILDGKNGDVADDVCFKICRDYFNDEIWKADDEEKAKKAERKKNNAKAISANVDDAMSDSDDDDEKDVPAIDPSEPKSCEGQLDMFAALGV